MIDLDTTETLESVVVSANERLSKPGLEAFILISFSDDPAGDRTVSTTFYGSEEHLYASLESIYQIAPHLFLLFGVQTLTETSENKVCH